MPRLVADGKSGAKVWHAWNDGAVLHVQFGRRGSKEHQTKELPSAGAAERELAKLVKQKLSSGYRDQAKVLVLEPCGLVLREIVDPPLIEPEDAIDAIELVDMAEGSVSDAFWHGDRAFALEKTNATWTFGVIERSKSSKKARWRPFEPRVTGTMFPSGFSTDGSRCIVSVPDGEACVFDCESFEREVVAPPGDEIVAAAFTRDFAALLRREDRKNRLELYRRERGWSLAHTIACGAQDALVPFADGRGLVVGSEPNDQRLHPKVHFLALDGVSPRLLGTCRFAHRWIADVDGKSYFQESSGRVLSSMPSELYAIEGFEEASARAAKKKAPQKLA